MTLAFSDHKFIWTIKMSSSLLLLLFPLNMNRQMYFIFRSVCFKPKFMLKAEKLNTDFLLQNLNLASFFLSLSLFLSFPGLQKEKENEKIRFGAKKWKANTQRRLCNGFQAAAVQTGPRRANTLANAGAKTQPVAGLAIGTNQDPFCRNWLASRLIRDS